MIRISPNEYITFSREELSGSLVELASISKFPVTFKIQTTSPEKFRVRPRCGVLNPGETTNVQIFLKPEYSLSEISKDKFLIMCIPVPEGINLSAHQLTEVWKQKQTINPDVEQHRLQCIYKSSSGSKHNGYAQAAELAEKKSPPLDLEKHAKKLEKQLCLTQILQCVTLIFLFLLAAAVTYLLKLQFNNSATQEEVTIPESEYASFSGSKGRQ